LPVTIDDKPYGLILFSWSIPDKHPDCGLQFPKNYESDLGRLLTEALAFHIDQYCQHDLKQRRLIPVFVLVTTITLQRLRKRGYISMLDLYCELNPSLCEPPYARTACTVV
jgi:hypothetical protein